MVFNKISKVGALAQRFLSVVIIFLLSQSLCRAKAPTYGRDKLKFKKGFARWVDTRVGGAYPGCVSKVAGSPIKAFGDDGVGLYELVRRHPEFKIMWLENVSTCLKASMHQAKI